METQVASTSTFILVFVAITVVPVLAGWLRMPVIVMELIFGIIVGKSFFDWIDFGPVVEFFSSFGLEFLMFLAGLEIDTSLVKKYAGKAVAITIFSVLVPFVAGYFMAPALDIHPLLLGTIYSTTSLGLILPLSRELKYSRTFKDVLLSSTILVDIISMFLLAGTLAYLQGALQLTFFYSFGVLLLLFILPLILKRFRLEKAVQAWLLMDRSRFEVEVRFSFALLLLLTAISGVLGFHSILGAFIAGLIITEVTHTGSILTKKMESFGYGFFVPMFFVFTGAKVDLNLVFKSLDHAGVLFLVLVTAIFSTVIGVTLVSRWLRFSYRESAAMGFFHASRLSLVIAVAEIGRQAGFIHLELFSMLVLLSITSAIIGPSLGKMILLGNRLEPEKGSAKEASKDRRQEPRSESNR
jgi:monovalent cation:H+ antiporter-2, CPA2 family